MWRIRDGRATEHANLLLGALITLTAIDGQTPKLPNQVRHAGQVWPSARLKAVTAMTATQHTP
jgi:hypothetical protein